MIAAEGVSIISSMLGIWGCALVASGGNMGIPPCLYLLLLIFITFAYCAKCKTT